MLPLNDVSIFVFSSIPDVFVNQNKKKSNNPDMTGLSVDVASQRCIHLRLLIYSQTSL